MASRSAVHPRWRGEHEGTAALRPESTGSSPLARGTPNELVRWAEVARFIPAGAGNTGPGHAAGSVSPVHPRWRGEHSRRRRWRSSKYGSSPLARGTQLIPDISHTGPRFIPAGAGNTAIYPSRRTPCSVHPRWRGEHAAPANSPPCAGGSSPLARGTPQRAGIQWSGGRFIPAGAGNTKWLITHACASTVHPRWRGEHLSACTRSMRSGGSSPLARGTRACSTACGTSGRFIPAGAGNTVNSSCWLALATVHPRWRGEHMIKQVCCVTFSGSSPLARGTRKCIRHREPAGRFIPAGAGNTSSRRLARRCLAVHPRWRGEHDGIAIHNTLRAGSSPLARGTHAQDQRSQALQRFIPAGAGNTMAANLNSGQGAVHPRWRGEHFVTFLC